MLYVFTGEREKALNHCRKVIEIAKTKNKSAQYIHLTCGNIDYSLEEILYRQGLFEEKYIVFCDEIFNEPAFEHLEENIKEYGESKHLFVLFEEKIKDSFFIKLKKYAKLINNFEKKEKEIASKEGFIFLDKFFTKRGEEALVSLEKLYKEGSDAERIIGLLNWQLRTLNIIALSKDLKESGLKPFLYQKGKKFLEKDKNIFHLTLEIEKTLRNKRAQGFNDYQALDFVISKFA